MPATKIEKIYIPQKHTYSDRCRFNAFIKNVYNRQKEIYIVCIGTDRVTGDALGPLIGTRLSNISKVRRRCKILGTLKDPVHARNISDIINDINRRSNKFVVAIDSSLGEKDEVGNIVIKNGPIKPGAAVNHSLPELGDISITGVVNESHGPGYMVLMNTRLYEVVQLSNSIARLISGSEVLTYQKAEVKHFG